MSKTYQSEWAGDPVQVMVDEGKSPQAAMREKLETLAGGDGMDPEGFIVEIDVAVAEMMEVSGG